MVFVDPLLPVISVPTDLKTQWFSLGSARYQLLPKQYEFMAAPEEFVGYVGGYGAGKTRVGAIKAAKLSMYPNNRGLVGRFAATDLEETSQRDLLDFLHEAELLKEAPNAKNRRALVYCVDSSNNPLGYISEISFQHLDNPEHLRGRHLGWIWIDEGSEVKRKAWQNLIGRLRLPAFHNRYKAMVTGNPEGHNWIYEFFFNEETLKSMICGKSDCALSDKECNRKIRRMRRAIHCTSYENYFLPPEYIDQMTSSFTEEERRRYVEASFDVFEGQIFKEFRHDLHVVSPPSHWANGRPPREWKRLLAVDVGGASPWAFLWSAVDPSGNIIFYDEIYRISTDVESLASEASPKMVDEEGRPYYFQTKVIDYENKVAAEDLRRRGIAFTNAAKHGKSGSIQRLSSYLHPNPRHCFPEWHPRAGSPNSPRAFMTTTCRNLIRELPQQRWKEDIINERMKDEPDRSVDNHATDCALYTVRELPDPLKLPPVRFTAKTANISKISELYWYDAKIQEERERQGQKRTIHPIRIPMVN